MVKRSKNTTKNYTVQIKRIFLLEHKKTSPIGLEANVQFQIMLRNFYFTHGFYPGFFFLRDEDL